jgi:YgiT-type zinc finger domain-containing protein
MKTPERKQRARPTLPDDACPACGTAMKERRGTLKLPVNGEEIAVPGASHLRCPSCGETVLRLDQARRLQEAAHALQARSALAGPRRTRAGPAARTRSAGE